MKKTILLFFVFCLSTVMFALSDTQRFKHDPMNLRVNENSVFFRASQEAIKNIRTDYYRFTNVIESTTTGIFRYSYSYNNSGIITQILTEKQSGDTYVNLYKTSYLYSNDNRLESYLIEAWTDNQWINNYQANYTYDEQNDITLFAGLSWTNNAWVDYYQNVNTYDDSHQLLQSIDRYFVSELWVNYYQYNYTYNADGLVTEYIYKEWLNESWTNSWKADYIYSDLLLDLETWYSWSNNWVADSRLNYNRTDSLLTEYLWEAWVNNAWVNSSKATVEYQNDHVTTITWGIWSGDVLVNSSKYQYTWDELGNNIMQDYALWTNNAWEYNTDQTLYVTYPYSVKGYVDFYGFRVNAQYEIYSVNNQDLTEINTNIVLKNYPNPFNPSTLIDYSLKNCGNYQLEIYNSKGQRIISKALGFHESGSYSQILDLTSYSSGVYLYAIRECSGKKSSQINKMILVK